MITGLLDSSVSPMFCCSRGERGLRCCCCCCASSCSSRRRSCSACSSRSRVLMACSSVGFGGVWPDARPVGTSRSRRRTEATPSARLVQKPRSARPFQLDALAFFGNAEARGFHLLAFGRIRPQRLVAVVQVDEADLRLL